jgi:hypothetical protein
LNVLASVSSSEATEDGSVGGSWLAAGAAGLESNPEITGC